MELGKLKDFIDTYESISINSTVDDSQELLTCYHKWKASFTEEWKNKREAYFAGYKKSGWVRTPPEDGFFSVFLRAIDCASILCAHNPAHGDSYPHSFAFINRNGLERRKTSVTEVKLMKDVISEELQKLYSSLKG